MKRFSRDKKTPTETLQAFRNPRQRGTSFAPPGFSLNASPVQTKKKEGVHQVPEKTGPVQEGPLAIKGRGDDQAMSASDINQGSIGNCYFLAALAAVAHSNPGALENSITDNKDGTYTVSLYGRAKDEIGQSDPERGTSKRTKLVKKTITVTADFPTSVDGHDSANLSDLSTTPPHALGGDKNKKGQTELWVRLIEKAYAVLNGGYDKIGNGGYGEAALEALTGKQFTEKAYFFSGSLKRRVLKSVKKKQPMTLTTGDQGDIDKLDADIVDFADTNDIVGGHVYTVLDADDEGVTLRNPWGSNASNSTPRLTWRQFKAIFSQGAFRA